jgi:Tol biopolymer transport system component
MIYFLERELFVSYYRLIIFTVFVSVFLTASKAGLAQSNSAALISANSARTNSGNNESFVNPVIPRSDISADGRFVVFESKASDLAPGFRDGNFASDVYLRDLKNGTTVLVSTSSSSTTSGNDLAVAPLISANGRFVAFESFATDLVPNDDNNAKDIFVRDMQTGNMSIVTLNTSGKPSQGGIFFVTLFAISADGRFVVFTSEASDLVTNDGNDSADLFVRDMVLQKNILVSVNLTNEASGNRTRLTSSGFFNFDPVITPDGRFIAFTSFNNDLTSNDNNCLNADCDGFNSLEDVFVRDIVTNTTTLVSINSKNDNGGNSLSLDPSISSDGRFVAFRSFSTDLVSNDRTENSDIYVRDLQRGITTLVSVNRAGTNGGTDGRGNGINSVNPMISPNGKFVAFSSVAVDLVSNKTDILTQDVFVRDLEKSTTTLASVNLTGTDSDSNANNQFGSIATDFSDDGKFLVFTSSSPDLVQFDNNNTNDVFVRDLTIGLTRLVSQNLTGSGSGNDTSTTGDISGNGKVVIFDSVASDLVENDTNRLNDVFAFTVPQAAPPIISSAKLNPSGKLTIKGSNFDKTSKLFIDNQQVNVDTTSSRKIVVKSINLAPGKHDARVVNPDGQVSLFTFNVN